MSGSGTPMSSKNGTRSTFSALPVAAAADEDVAGVAAEAEPSPAGTTAVLPEAPELFAAVEPDPVLQPLSVKTAAHRMEGRTRVLGRFDMWPMLVPDYFVHISGPTRSRACRVSGMHPALRSVGFDMIRRVTQT